MIKGINAKLHEDMQHLQMGGNVGPPKSHPLSPSFLSFYHIL